MPTIEEVDSDFSDPDDAPLPDLPPPASKPAPPRQQPQSQPVPPPSSFNIGALHPGLYLPEGMAPPGSGFKTLSKDVYKSWTSIYPIYIDAKKPHTAGQRRVSKSKALFWPLAEAMAKATAGLGLQVVFEPNRTHPRDWENPGRLKVLLKDPTTGAVKNSYVKDKKQLLDRICTLLGPHQVLNPTPTTLPPIHLRYPPNSPAISHGALESAMKGGGPLAGLLGAMGGAPGGAEEEKKDEEEEVKKVQPKIMQKPRKVHLKKKR